MCTVSVSKRVNVLKRPSQNMKQIAPCVMLATRWQPHTASYSQCSGKVEPSRGNGAEPHQFHRNAKEGLSSLKTLQKRW